MSNNIAINIKFKNLTTHNTLAFSKNNILKKQSISYNYDFIDVEPSQEELYGSDYGYEDPGIIAMDDNPFEDESYTLDDWDNDAYWWNDEYESHNTFENLTDQQYNYLATISWHLSENPNNIVVGNCLKDIALFRKIGDKLPQFKVHNVIQGKDGFTAMVLVDNNGNYTIINACTTKDFNNVCYDLYPILQDIGLYDDSDTMELLGNLMGSSGIKKYILKLICNMGVDKKIVNQYFEKYSVEEILAEIKRIYDSQNEQAALLASDYYFAAYNKGVELNFFGYSKGGGIAEYMYLSCLGIYDIEYIGASRMGKMVTYNPYHYYGLSKKDIKVLTNADYELYRQDGDYVSTVFHENAFNDNTIAIGCDWQSFCSQHDSIMGAIGDGSIGYLFMGGAHSPSNASDTAYNEEGLVVNNVDLTTSEEIAEYMLGNDFQNPIDDLKTLFDLLDPVAEEVNEFIDASNESGWALVAQIIWGTNYFKFFDDLEEALDFMKEKGLI